MSQTARHIIFVGHVQGIGFRFTAHNVAKQYELTGLVRNLKNGTVEMIVQGNADDIAACIDGIQQTFVNCISETRIEEIPIAPPYKEFKITV